MTRHEDHDGEERVARTLRASVPAPSRDFVRSLERRLLPSRRPFETALLRLARPRRPARLQLAVATAALSLAALLLAAGLAGGGPLDDDDSQADVDCKTVWLERRAREPVLRKAPDGSVRLDYRWRTAPRPVVRCR